MKGPRRARMPVNWAGSKCLGRTQKETGWLRFHAPQPPAIPIAPLQLPASCVSLYFTGWNPLWPVCQSRNANWLAKFLKVTIFSSVKWPLS